MNIFVVDMNPQIAAESLCEKHVVKMPVESMQMCITSYYVINGITKTKQITQTLCEQIFPNWPRKINNSLKYYGCSYINHPCTIWTRSNIENFKWLLTHGLSLCKEYTKIYNKQHACESIFNWMENNLPALPFADNISTFPLCMPDEFKTNDTVQSYRNYYISKVHSGICSWNKFPNRKPLWI